MPQPSTGQKPGPKPLPAMLELFRQEGWDPGAIQYLALGIEKAVKKSMQLEPTLRLDRGQEARRRAKMCLDLYRIMANDLKWGARRAADQLEIYLLKKLRGEPVDFPNRSAWFGPGRI